MTVSLPPHDAQTMIATSLSAGVGPFLASTGCLIAHHNEQPALHPTSGFLFCTRNGKPLSPSNIIRRHLHKALKQLNYVNPFTGTHKAGNHGFRRFRF